jgi:CRISPR-associated protein Cas8c/Csd1, subtype I-C/DVULG
MQKLYETYENCQSLVGKAEDGKPPLMPIYHTTQQAQVEVVVDTDGNWRSAQVITEKSKRTTLIPCTEKSASRTNSPVPHPLFDNLSYLAGDYENYRHAKEGEHRYQEYIEQLSGWCASPYAHPKVCAVLEYLEKGTLMEDLIHSGVLFRDEADKLPETWDGSREDIPPIFRACPGDQATAFVRFQVVQADGSEDLQSSIWEDKTVWQSFIDYQNSLPADKDFCYVLGKEIPASSLSPKYIRRPGDGAKLISANDSAGFTYRGRFETPSQAYCVGRETTEKAHNALKWLIPRQAYSNGDQVILSWTTDGGKALDPCKNSLDLSADLRPDEPVITTGENFAAQFRKALAGYGRNLKGGEDACVIGLDSATPGRLSIFYYREMPEQELVQRVQSWHETCSWILMEFPHDKREKSERAKPIFFRGAPAPKDIVTAAYGRQASDKLSKSTVQRLLPCIVDGAALPQDLMLCAVRRASNPMGMETPTEGQQTLRIACALVRKYHNDKEYKERWGMALNPDETDRSYLFGRAFAYAQQIESYALSIAGENRSTNAERMQMAFTQHPAKIMKNLHSTVMLSLQKLGGRGNRYRDGFNEVLSKIEIKDFTDVPLTELYLLGYVCQMQKFSEEKQNYINKKTDAAESDNEGEENS